MIIRRKIVKVDDYLDTMRIVEKLSKKKSDLHKHHTELILLEEERLEARLLLAFDKIKKEVLKKFDENFPKVYNKSAAGKIVNDLAKINFEPRYNYSQVGIFRFKVFTFSVEMKEWLEKSGGSISNSVEVISSIQPEPFQEALDDSTMTAHLKGGQSVFNIFDIKADFALRDVNVERIMKDYNIKLSSQVGKQLQTMIKKELLEGVKNADSIPQLRNRIIGVFDKGIDVNVPAKVDAAGNILRQGYSYQLSSKDWATTVARTEVIKNYNAGRLQGFKQIGVVERVEFSVSPDERLCPVCSGLDGTTYTLDQAEAQGLIPQHPNCRCVFIPLLGEMDYATAKKTAQENITKLYQNPREKLKAEYKNIKFEDLDKLADEVINDLQTALDNLTAEYGKNVTEKVCHKFGSIEQYCIKHKENIAKYDSTYAFSTRTDEIYFNLKYFGKGNYERLTKQIKMDILTGWHPKGCEDPLSVIYHEMMHNIDKSLLNANIDIHFKREAIAKTYTMLNSDKSLGKILSEYAKENDKEFFAEMFSQYKIAPDKMSPILKMKMKELEKLIKEGIEHEKKYGNI